jgi:drug/metabolite transporter (DMT)-like permease
VSVVAKKVGGDARFAFFTGGLMMLVWAPVGIWQSWLQLPDWGWQAYGVVVVSGILHVGYYLVLLRGYREADLTVVYPLARGSGPLLSSTMAILFLGEQLSALGAVGIAAVVGGVFLVAGGPSLFRKAKDAASRRRVRAGVFFGLVTGVFIAGYTVVDGWGVKVLGLSPILVDYLGNVARLIILVPVVLSMRAGLGELFRLQWKGALVVATISPVSYVLVLYAMQTAPLSHVAPAREVSMLFAALIGGHLLAEGDRLVRVLGAACIAAGVMALALG